ncbi:MAG: hypothetical protein D6681_04385 [Calditrichaeota bacterium]|nr:MAG: hypothetical protein D6681_04385 [Calditrichota bacterium]
MIHLLPVCPAQFPVGAAQADDLAQMDELARVREKYSKEEILQGKSGLYPIFILPGRSHNFSQFFDASPPLCIFDL